jgi:hypothetical protein
MSSDSIGMADFLPKPILGSVYKQDGRRVVAIDRPPPLSSLNVSLNAH